ncbi:uncharacterized protein LOC107432025 [Ziziphus jujuba]|uniref:tRNA-uridine aminocarboxypropyltransferase n=2 Tax=Ziziphus jujuba TaxID=326968 RepID=A0A6P4AL04_ZIZJJ|nr:uncharacterized protein LOC107432025 [Ziziphus jujuba]KAH7546696.1 hypothetical protein FEM48_Zijuj01G0229000 [Ziziphus jujuba var. spinosa]
MAVVIYNQLCALFQKPFFFPPRTRKMVATQAGSKRPTCASCSKPAWLCLCKRIKKPRLDNSVRVTILQHSLEKKHPLNSAKIARLGLKNLIVSAVSDVHMEARFVIRSLDQNCDMGSNGVDCDQHVKNMDTRKSSFEECSEMGSEEENVDNSECESFAKCPREKSIGFVDANGKCSLESDIGCENTRNELESDEHGVGKHGPIITATVGKHGVVISLSHSWMQQSDWEKPDFNKILDTPAACTALSKGFSVRKLQKQPVEGRLELEEEMEFEIDVPPGSALLYPTKEAFSINGVEDINFEVKNLIVLDGTWSKAKKMYAENPWLKFLPHLKLELDKVSLYGEVRIQPKAGCLSTLESIVYALRAVGDNVEGLDNLLDVLESMVVDQKRCKEERLSNAGDV